MKKVRTRPSSTKKAAKRRTPSLPNAGEKSSPSDSMLIAGGIVLVILVLGDTVLLALSRRFLRV